MAHPTQLNPTEQDALVKQIGLALLRAAPQDWEQIVIDYRAVGRHQESNGRVTTDSGEARPWRISGDIATLFAKLRAGMYREGRGTWFNARYQLDRPTSYNLEYDRDEPTWEAPPPPPAYGDELRIFPRDEENVPDWLMRRLAGLAPERPGPHFRIARAFDGMGPSGRPVVNRPPVDDADLDGLREYLDRAPVVIPGRGFDVDRLDAEARQSVPVAFHSDGTWIWPASINYYLRKYRVPPEPDLVEHARQQNFTVPELDEATTAAAAAFLDRAPRQGPPPAAPPQPTQAMPARPPAGPAGPGGPPGRPPAAALPSHGGPGPTLNQLTTKLAEYGVPESVVRIGQPVENTWTLERGDEGWRVGFFQRGEFVAPAVFEDVADASAFLLGKVLMDAGWQRQAPARPPRVQQFRPEERFDPSEPDGEATVAADATPEPFRPIERFTPGQPEAQTTDELATPGDTTAVQDDAETTRRTGVDVPLRPTSALSGIPASADRLSQTLARLRSGQQFRPEERFTAPAAEAQPVPEPPADPAPSRHGSSEASENLFTTTDPDAEPSDEPAADIAATTSRHRSSDSLEAGLAAPTTDDQPDDVYAETGSGYRSDEPDAAAGQAIPPQDRFAATTTSDQPAERSDDGSATTATNGPSDDTYAEPTSQHSPGDSFGTDADQAIPPDQGPEDRFAATATNDQSDNGYAETASGYRPVDPSDGTDDHATPPAERSDDGFAAAATNGLADDTASQHSPGDSYDTDAGQSAPSTEDGDTFAASTSRHRPSEPFDERPEIRFTTTDSDDERFRSDDRFTKSGDAFADADSDLDIAPGEATVPATSEQFRPEDRFQPRFDTEPANHGDELESTQLHNPFQDDEDTVGEEPDVAIDVPPSQPRRAELAQRADLSDVDSSAANLGGASLFTPTVPVDAASRTASRSLPRRARQEPAELFTPAPPVNGRSIEEPPAPAARPEPQPEPRPATKPGMTPAGGPPWPIKPMAGEPPLTLFRGKEMRELATGTEIDRYGDPDGNLTYTVSTPFEQRSLVPDWVHRPYHAYRVAQPVEVLTGVAIPWFDQPGGGTAFMLPESVGDLLDAGYLVEVEDAKAPD